MLWIGRGSASELAFLHALADRLEGRAVFLADVTGHQMAEAVWRAATDPSMPPRTAAGKEAETWMAEAG